MKLLKNAFFTFVLGNAFLGVTQIEISEETQEKENKQEEVKDYGGHVEAFVLTNWSSTSRKLIENDAPYGDPLGTRADEDGLNTWSFGLGIRSQVNPYFAWEGGISYLRNGESYSFEDSDTSHNYQTTYSYIAMPFKAYFTIGDQFKLLAGGGVVPQMFLNYKQDREWVDAKNTKTTEEFSTRSGYNSFAISAVFNIGAQLNFGKRTSILFIPEYRIQLSSSYQETSSFKHYGRELGFNIGLSFKL